MKYSLFPYHKVFTKITGFIMKRKRKRRKILAVHMRLAWE